MEKLLFLFVVLMSMGACTNHSVVDISKNDLYHIQLIDSFSNKLDFDRASQITNAAFYPMYIGQQKDSIVLVYTSKFIHQRSFDWYQFKSPDSTDLEIFVNHAKLIGSVHELIMPPPPPPPELAESFEWEYEYYRGPVRSYPVFIKNKSRDTLNISYGAHLPLLIEAQDSLGNWRRIQEHYKYSCSTGIANFHLPPDEILLTSCKLFTGAYQTKMRLVFGFKDFHYSNEFVGSMNYTQFEEVKDIY